MARRSGRAPLPTAGAILSCVYLAAVLVAPATIARASPIAILSKQRDGSDVFTKIVGALCEKNKGKEDDQSFCRHFEDKHEVSSLLTQNVEAFDAIVTEVWRGTREKEREREREREKRGRGRGRDDRR